MKPIQSSPPPDNNGNVGNDSYESNSNGSEGYRDNDGYDSREGSRKLGRLIMQLRRLERSPRSFGTAGPLTPSEIHTIEAIGTGKALPMSELAARLGVTKGAVTQLTARLTDKRLVKRTPHPDDARGSMLALTPLGIEAYEAHDEVRHAFYAELRSTLSEEEIRVFELCLDKLNHFLEG